MITETSIYIEKRFEVLRNIIAMYQARITYMEKEVVQLFAANQLDAILECMQEKQRIELLVKKLDQFVTHWEAIADMSIDH